MNLKQFLPRSLFGRTFLIIMMPALLLQIAVSTVFFDRHWSRMTDRLASSVAGEITLIVNQVTQGKLPIENNDFEPLGLQFTLKQNLFQLPQISEKNIHTITNDLSNHLQDSLSIPFIVQYYPGKKIITVHTLTSSGVLSIRIPEGRLFSSSSYIFILWMIGLSIILFTIALIFMRNQIRPIYRLGLIAEKLGRGIPIGSIKPTGAHEVRLATQAFITMQDRINQFIDQRTTMLAGVSHDLRTPLTRMKLQIEMMDNNPDTAAIKNDIADMESMIEGYLSFAKGDDGEKMQRINLHNFLDKTIGDARRLSLNVDDQRDKNRTEIVLWAKPNTLARAFDNIISNAAHYSTQVTLETIVTKNNTISIIITDNGPGIDKDKIDDVLNPFVRGDESRNNKTGGVGLGLTITNDIITAHGGTTSISNKDDKCGLIVTISLPL
jgi:two-component system osmolarity sensor histidine kinase EnvZ